MYILKAFVIFFWVGLSTSSTSAANKSQSLTLAQNINVTNTHEYWIHGVNPAVFLIFSHLSQERIVHIDAPSVYMCAIEDLARICRYHPRDRQLLKPEVLRYRTATIRMQGSKTPPYFTHNAACAVLRGLAEFMTQNNWWFECSVRVLVQGTDVGSVLVWNPEGDGGVALTDTA